MTAKKKSTKNKKNKNEAPIKEENSISTEE